MDNVSFHKGKDVKFYCDGAGIIQILQPVYSP